LSRFQATGRIRGAMFVSHMVAETLLDPISFMAYMALVRFLIAVKNLDVTPHVPQLNKDKRFLSRFYNC